MFNLFNTDQDVFTNTTKHLSTQIIAIISLLADKGIISDQEYLKYQKDAEKIVNKIFEDEKIKQKENFKKEYPTLAKILGTD